MFTKSAATVVARMAILALVLPSCLTSAPKAVVTDASVTESKIGAEAVTNSKLAANSVTTPKIVDLNVTTAKIADGAVTTAKLGTIDVNAFTNFVRSGGNTGAFSVGTDDATAFTLETNNSTRMTITADGQINMAHTDSDNEVTANGIVASSSIMSIGSPGASTESYYGAFNEAILTGAGTPVQASGVLGRVSNQNAAGTITTGIGVDSEIFFNAAGDMTFAYNFHGKVTNPAAVGAMGNYVGLYLEDPDTAVTTAFATTRYGIFSDGAATKNFFLGNVGIGAAQTNPLVALSVTGAGNFTGALTLPGLAADAGNTALCHTTATGNVTTAVTACTVPSDRRFKEKIVPVEGALEKILKISGVSYFWKDKAKRGTQRELGVIAQEVLPVFPEAVIKGEDGFYGVYYFSLISPLIEAVKELHAKWNDDHKQLEKQKVILSELQKKVEIENLALRSENRQLKDRLEKIELALAQAAPDKSIGKKAGRKLASVKE